jgi:hypothetical protein
MRSRECLDIVGDEIFEVCMEAEGVCRRLAMYMLAAQPSEEVGHTVLFPRPHVPCLAKGFELLSKNQDLPVPQEQADINQLHNQLPRIQLTMSARHKAHR